MPRRGARSSPSRLCLTTASRAGPYHIRKPILIHSISESNEPPQGRKRPKEGCQSRDGPHRRGAGLVHAVVPILCVRRVAHHPGEPLELAGAVRSDGRMNLLPVDSSHGARVPPAGLGEIILVRDPLRRVKLRLVHHELLVLVALQVKGAHEIKVTRGRGARVPVPDEENLVKGRLNTRLLPHLPLRRPTNVLSGVRTPRRDLPDAQAAQGTVALLDAQKLVPAVENDRPHPDPRKGRQRYHALGIFGQPLDQRRVPGLGVMVVKALLQRDWDQVRLVVRYEEPH
mmetsp:Transcript_3230/g.11717  ORF Transcript_3230/g.11717 Transcript_3230/m.11717 type:complete len:285 (-) Transcript_3230:229-1083(-)